LFEVGRRSVELLGRLSSRKRALIRLALEKDEG
jgi:hypothetical protein